MTSLVRRHRAAAGALIVAILTVGVLVYARRPGTKQLVADFANTTNLYQGAQVKVLGVTIGAVDSIAVTGTTVRVTMHYDADRPLPADVHAAIVPPSIVGDRFVQLTPPYRGGPQLPDHATLNLSRTEVPVELDHAFATLNDLATKLGPNEINKDGALSELLSTASASLRGNGRAANDTVHELSGAVSTLGDSRTDLASTVANLSSITRTLAIDDGQVRALVTNLAAVADELNDQRDQLGAATRTLSLALADINRFIRDNRAAVTEDVHGLADVTDTVVRRRRNLIELLDVLPVAASNVYNVILPDNWDPARPNAVFPEARTSALVPRLGGLADGLPVQLAHFFTTLCSRLPAADQAQLRAPCASLQGVGGSLGERAARGANVLLGPGLGDPVGPPLRHGEVPGGRR